MPQIKVKFYKVVGLPSEPEPNTFYFIEDGDNAESYLTDADGVAKRVGNTVMIDAMLAELLSDSDTIIDGGTI